MQGLWQAYSCRVPEGPRGLRKKIGPGPGRLFEGESRDRSGVPAPPSLQISRAASFRRGVRSISAFQGFPRFDKGWRSCASVACNHQVRRSIPSSSAACSSMSAKACLRPDPADPSDGRLPVPGDGACDDHFIGLGFELFEHLGSGTSAASTGTPCRREPGTATLDPTGLPPGSAPGLVFLFLAHGCSGTSHLPGE